MKSICLVKKILVVLVFAVTLAGCVGSVERSGRPVGGDDGYVPWWVEEKVPNSEGVVVTF